MLTPKIQVLNFTKYQNIDYRREHFLNNFAMYKTAFHEKKYTN